MKACAVDYRGVAVGRTQRVEDRDREALRRTLLARGCPPQLIARELQRQYRLRPRVAFREAHGWSQDELARRYDAVAGLGGDAWPAPATMTGTRIGDYERWPLGGRRPSLYVVTTLAQVFNTTLDQLVDAADLAGMPFRERVVYEALLKPSCTPQRGRA